MSTYRVGVPALRPGDPEIFFDGTAIETDALPFAVTTADIGNRAESGALDFRKQVYRMRRAVRSVAGDRIGIENTHNNETRPQGWMNGATYRVYRHDAANRTFTKVRSGTVAAYHARQFSNYVCMGDDEKTTDTFYHTTWTANYKPNATAYWVIATLNAAGDRSPWSAPIAFSSGSAADTGKSASVPANPGLTASTLSGVEDAALAAPTGFTAALVAGDPKSIRFDWNAVAGAAGYIVKRSDDDPAAGLVTGAFDMTPDAGAAAVQVGDLVFLEKRFGIETSRDSYRTIRNWKEGRSDVNPFERLGPSTSTGPAVTDVLEDANGQPYYRMDIPAGSIRKIRVASYGGGAQTFYTLPALGQTYALRFRARRVSGTGTLRLTMTGDYIAPQDVALTTAWQDFEFTFQGQSAMASDTKSYPIELTFNGAGVFEMSYYWTGRIEAGDAPMRLTPGDLDVFKSFAPSFVRIHRFIKSNPHSNYLAQVTDEAGVQGYSLPQHLDIIEAGNSKPWLQFDWVWDESEFLGLAEYLAAPYDPAVDTPAAKPWAHKRHASGRTIPPIDSFGRILMEFGNENWNFSPEFWTMPDLGNQVAGSILMAHFQNYLWNVMKTSPYWPRLEGRFDLVPSGWKQISFWTEGHVRETVEGKYMTLNLYNGDNWEENGGTGELLTYSDRYVAFVLQGVPTRWQPIFDAAKAARDRINALRGPTGVQVELAGYEQNHTTPKLPSSGDSEAASAEQERTWAAKGVQHAIVDQFCAYAANGGKLQNYFVFGAGTTWNSHGAPGRGGVRASFQWLGLINREVMQDVDAARVLKVYKADIASDGALYPGVPQVACYFFRKAGKLGVVVINRRIPGQFGDDPANNGGVAGDGISNVVLRLPPGFTAGTKWTMTGAFSDHNSTAATANALTLESTPLPGPLNAIETSLPPGDCQVFILT